MIKIKLNEIIYIVVVCIQVTNESNLIFQLLITPFYIYETIFILIFIILMYYIRRLLSTKRKNRSIIFVLYYVRKLVYPIGSYNAATSISSIISLIV